MNKGLEKYTQAKDISFDKMLGAAGKEGVKFYETKKKDGTVLYETHRALPVTLENLDKLEDYIDQIDDLTSAYRKDGEVIYKKMLENEDKIKNGKAEEGDKALEEITTFSKELRKLTRKKEKELIDIKLDIAVLCLSRTEDTSKEEVRKWIDKKDLDDIVDIARGMSYPPKQSGEQEGIA